MSNLAPDYHGDSKVEGTKNQVKRLVGFGIEEAHGGTGVAPSGAVKQEQDGVVEHGKGEGGADGSDLASIFAEGSVTAPVIAVFDVPVVTEELEQAMR